jgi:hypothetical protein
MLCRHFRALPLEDVPGFLALYYPKLLNHIFSLHYPFGIHYSYWRLISCGLSIWASIKASSSPVSASSINPSEKSLCPRKGTNPLWCHPAGYRPKMYHIQYLAGTSYPSKPCFRLVSVLQTCTAISFPIRPSLALIGPFISHH